MLLNNLYPIYNEKEKCIQNGKMYSACDLCLKWSSDNKKKCLKYYEKLICCEDGTYDCPYGLTSIIEDGNIFTGLFPKDKVNNKMKNNFRKKIKSELKLNVGELEQLIKYNIESANKIERYRETTHDLRNMAANFNAMIDEFIIEKKDVELSDCELSMISLYELINFRLDILSNDVELTLITEKEQKLHPMIKKLSHILYYSAKKKHIKIKINPNQTNWFSITKALYLSVFILLENAIKYAIPYTDINITFEEDTQHSSIIMTNIADKIKVDRGNDLLKRGVRGNNAKSLGSGIGLSLAAELLEKMNANIDIEIKNHQNNNSLFSVKITLTNVIKQDV